MRVGFTGTREGLSMDQVLHVHMLLADLRTAGASEASHGMCVGGDADFHGMAQSLGYFMIGCPGVTPDGTPKHRAVLRCDLVLPEKPFLARNITIVRESDVLIAAPAEAVEQLRSGTWATIRFARKAEKPLVLVWPEGDTRVEHVDGVETAEDYRRAIKCRRRG